MVTIIHGDDIALSRKAYIELKQKSQNAIVLDGEKITFSDMVLSLSSDLLFSDEKDIFIENFFTKRKLIAKETKEIISYIQKDKNNVVFWESKKLTKPALNNFPKAAVKQFNIPQTLFGFIDKIHPNSPKKLIELFHNALTQSEAELIFFMMVRQLRILLALETGSEIEELAKLAPWQMSNLSNQGQNFPLEQLKKAYAKLYEIDLAQKTGTTSLSLTQSIDMFLLDL